jgi:hypothetical protein
MSMHDYEQSTDDRIGRMCEEQRRLREAAKAAIATRGNTTKPTADGGAAADNELLKARSFVDWLLSAFRRND